MKQILAYKDYYENFYLSLSQIERDKVDRVLVLMQSENRMPTHFIKPLEDGIQELRITTLNKELRILFIYDGARLVILLNCFVKKSRKTPRAEIEKAKKIRRQYEEEKRQQSVL